jgi:hypothetical protein
MPYQAISKIVTEEDLQAVKAAIARIKANQFILASLTAARRKQTSKTKPASSNGTQNPSPSGPHYFRQRLKDFPAVEFVKGLAELVAAMEKLMLEIEAARPAAAGRATDVFDVMRQAQQLAGASQRFSVDRCEARD